MRNKSCSNFNFIVWFNQSFVVIWCFFASACLSKIRNFASLNSSDLQCVWFSQLVKLLFFFAYQLKPYTIVRVCWANEFSWTCDIIFLYNSCDHCAFSQKISFLCKAYYICRQPDRRCTSHKCTFGLLPLSGCPFILKTKSATAISIRNLLCSATITIILLLGSAWCICALQVNARTCWREQQKMVNLHEHEALRGLLDDYLPSTQSLCRIPVLRVRAISFSAREKGCERAPCVLSSAALIAHF